MDLTVHEIRYKPVAMGAKEAAAFLGVKETQFRAMCDLYPDRLRCFNYVPNGQRMWRTESLEEFARWKESIGLEKAG